MRFFDFILPLVLLASPIAAETITCTGKDTSTKKNKSWKVSVETAKEEMKKAGISTQGRTGYPHAYRNFQGLDWSVATCKKTNIDLLEYPVFWVGHSQLDNTVLTKDQAKTPIRVVYANDGGAAVYCGLMIHEEVTREADVNREQSWQGLEGFHICE
ncbi:hypothetical protein BO70DRAFT_352273 [Aspergillus heteromorphus CBS 117.55]|uniref:Uncharacterized protein n=1 Tax=Aspergillus heteromorphus CBS 117.55 TaxID=1448321 RepID=A0A317WBU1_9EURO|nr:uncharacterized protein BO70DRAFT_352273 [Aspergillus heteromorphus CBS 117.55]PWY83415.1 hypothetical protein BO70DRAFT_352273 [Aspergillus heteromorphus CBS 117.55]